MGSSGATQVGQEKVDMKFDKKRLSNHIFVCFSLLI